MSPLLHEMAERGETDEPLDNLTTNVLDSVRLLVMTNASLVHKRKEVHKPYMKPEFVRAISKIKESEKDPAWLYGKAVEIAVSTYEKTRKAARGAMKDTQQQSTSKKTHSNQPQSKKAKYGGNKPQNKQGHQNSFGNFHYQQQQQQQHPGFGGFPFNPAMQQGFNNNNFNPGFRPRNPNWRPRHQAPPAASGSAQSGFQKKGNKQ